MSMIYEKKPQTIQSLPTAVTASAKNTSPTSAATLTTTNM